MVVLREAPPAAPAPAPVPAAAEEKPLELPADALAPPAVLAARDHPLPTGRLGPEDWAYVDEGETRGPIGLDDLIDLVLTTLPEDTPVWRQGQQGWTAANLVPEIAEQIPPPLPAAGPPQEDFPDFDSVPQMLRVVLIADEDGAFRKRLALPLAAQGFTIHEARDGAEAWRAALDHRPWLILADVGLPEMDGFEFCRRARANSMLRRTPLVFISGYDRYKDRYRAMQLGADDFLSKTTPVRELLIRIQLLMTRYSDLESAGRKAREGERGALEGRIEVFGAPGVVQILNQGGVTGVLTARSQAEGGEAAVFGFRQGEIVSAACQEHSGPDAVYAFLAWERGQFRFVPGDPGAGAPIAQSVEHLLLEGCRLLDESRRGPDDPGVSA
ncbi:MAG TPA: response regulator [Vicinamibacteria bacterium]|nr:response regulator [Vicinamibacteria bacterium]